MPREITPATWRSEPWKNGRGTTREVIRWPASAQAGNFDVRVSVADVARGGGFSTFPGYHRWTTRLPGPAIGLVTWKSTYWLEVGQPLQLDGETKIDALVPDGPVQLLNILARPDQISVGGGPCTGKVRFVFELDTKLARVLDDPAPVAGNVVWLAWNDWRKDPERRRKGMMAP